MKTEPLRVNFLRQRILWLKEVKTSTNEYINMTCQSQVLDNF